MAKEKNESMKEEKKHCRKMHNNSAGGAIYGLGLIVALFYFLQHATTFGLVIFGILKSIVWPAFLIFKLLEFLKV